MSPFFLSAFSSASVFLSFSISALFCPVHPTNKNIIQKHINAHNKNIELFINRFGDKLAFIERLKGVFSLQLKTASLGIGSQKVAEIMNTISDVSGFCFILEKPEDYNYFIKTLSEMIKHGEVNPIEVEYHRLPDIYKKGQKAKSFNKIIISQ